MVIRTIMVFSLFIVCSSSIAQQFHYADRYLITGTVTISPGFFTENSGKNLYLKGQLEYFLEKRISLRGDAYWFLGSHSETETVDANSHFLMGMFYHFPKNRLDISFGFQPGLSMVRPSESFTGPNTTSYPLKMVPNFSMSGNLIYYFFDYCNFFLSVHYLQEKYRRAIPSLDEVILSGGLGFHFKPKKNSKN